MIKHNMLCLAVYFFMVSLCGAASEITWQHLSTKQGDLEVPNAGKQQTSSIILDADLDGIQDFVITERTQSPAVVLYLRKGDGWTKHVIDQGPLERGDAFVRRESGRQEPDSPG